MGKIMKHKTITVVGGGLAGSEAAWQLARLGFDVRLYEMKPVKFSPAHRMPYLGELVCSNSFRSLSLTNAAGLLKAELELAGSLIMECALQCRVPAGGALGIDREAFAREVTRRLEAHPRISIIREEIREVPLDRPVIIATGPLTSDALAESITRLTGTRSLHFYDAVSPIVDAETVDMRYAFWGSRYGRGGDDYLNCPLTEEEYRAFWEALKSAERYPLKEFEDLEELRFFEGCLPMDEMARRGYETLLYGPMKPVGLTDPRTGREPFAVLQLRKDNVAATLLSIVGGQTTLRHGEQQRVFRLVPALRHAEFVRFGMVHRNTYLNSPKLLNEKYQSKAHPMLFFAGQMTGVEGYIESTASGWVAALAMAFHLLEVEWIPLPRTTAMGALAYYVAHADPENFQPMNINWGIIEPIAGRFKNREQRRRVMAERALSDLDEWLITVEDVLKRPLRKQGERLLAVR